MGITNKAISTKFLNIIIRTNHGQTEIVMQYGDFRSSVTQELCDTFVHQWNNIIQALIQRLIGSMRQRCEAVVDARGGHTRN
jgi:hypothetical protein